MAHIRNHALVKRAATAIASPWFESNAAALDALAFFELALYEPTKAGRSGRG